MHYLLRLEPLKLVVSLVVSLAVLFFEQVETMELPGIVILDF